MAERTAEDVKPLYVFLNTEYYRAFESGEKTCEYRPYNSRWSEDTCPLGRPVILCRGYSTPDRMRGVVASFRRMRYSDLSVKNQAAWLHCYGPSYNDIAEIGITITRPAGTAGEEA